MIIYNRNMNTEKKIDYNQKILDCLKLNPHGLTISGVSKEVSISRNTAYRYLGVLEAKNLIFTKVIGNFILYFSKEKSIDIGYLDNVISIYMRLLFNLKKEFSNQETIFKRIGKDLSNIIDVPSDTKEYEQLDLLKSQPNKKCFEEIGKLIHYFTLFDNKVNVKIIDMNRDYTKATYLLSNSIMLSENMDYLYHFNILLGILEEKLKKILNKDFKCELLEYEILEKIEDSYVKISIEIV